MVIDQPPPADSPQGHPRVVFLGPDPGGAMLEVMASETDNEILVIHAMPLRRKYEDYLKGGKDEQT